MSVDVVGQNLAAFEQIANGEYNEGNVVMVGDRGLSKLNGHHTFTILNHKTITEQQNQAVRAALYNAIVHDDRGSTLSAGQLAAIRTRLGLGADGEVAQANIANTPLSRREVKQIISFVREANLGQDKFKSDIAGILFRKIESANLGDGDRMCLDANLRGVGGQLDTQMEALGGQLVVQFNNLAIDDLAPTADPQKGNAKKLAQGVLLGLSNYIDFFCTYAQCARAELEEKAEQESQSLANLVNGLAAELDRMGGAVRADEREAAQKLIDELRAAAANLRNDLDEDLCRQLSGLKTTDILPPHAPARLGAEFVQRKVLERNIANTQKVTALGRKLAEIQNRIATEAQQRVADQQKLDAGRNAIVNELGRLERAASARNERLAALRKDAGELQQNPRTEERLDGDAFAATVEKIAALHEETLKAVKALQENTRAKLGDLTAATVEACQKEVTETCAKLLADEEQAVKDLLTALNASLKYTVVPLPGEDPAQAAEATAQKRAALTEKLEKEWTDAENECKTAVETFRKMDGTDPNFDFLSPEQKKERDERLAAIVARFSPALKGDYVKVHSIRQSEPKAILKKALTDATALMANVHAANLAAAHRHAQRHLDLLAGWVKRDADALKTIDADFKAMSGLDLWELVGHDTARLGTLHHALIFLAEGALKALSGQIHDMRHAQKDSSYVETRLRALTFALKEQVAAIVGKLRNPEVAGLNEEAFLARLPEATETQRLRAKYIGELETQSRKLSEDVLKVELENPDGVDRLSAQKKRLTALLIALREDGANVGLKPTLSLAQLKGVTGFFSTSVDPDKLEALLATGEHGVPAVDPQTVPTVNVTLGDAPAARPLGEGLDDNLVEGPLPVPEKLSRLDAVINA